MSSYFWIHSKFLFWQFYIKRVLITHGEKHAASLEYTNKCYCRKCLGNFTVVMEELDIDFAVEDNKANMKTRMKKIIRWIDILITSHNNPFDNPLTVFEKLINFDDFLQNLKLDSKRYVSQNDRIFLVSLD